VEIDPVPEGLDGGDDPGRKRTPGHNLEVTAQGPEGAAAEIAEESISVSPYAVLPAWMVLRGISVTRRMLRGNDLLRCPF
jgi:hypothetical protein